MRFHAADLTYCMNVHPAASMVDVMENVVKYAVPVKEQVCPDAPFGLGLWLPSGAVCYFADHAAQFVDLLCEHDLYAFTFNGFPYGIFHGARVKEQVYQPDWGKRARVDYTEALLVALSSLLPKGRCGSISTVPVCYGKTLPAEAIYNLRAAADTARQISRIKNKKMFLALEPEPDCYLENTDDVLRFFELLRREEPGITDVLGVCLDTCHFALQRECPREAYRRIRAAGIPIPKVQLSTALTYRSQEGQDGSETRAALAPFADDVYLHQTRVVGDGNVQRFSDLPQALQSCPEGEWLIHFHVPLHFSGNGAVGSTQGDLTAEFLRELADEPGLHLEIETYTFLVLPNASQPVRESIADEYRFVLSGVG